MRNRPDEGAELLDQPRRQTMSFGNIDASLEADPRLRIIKLLFLVEDVEKARDYQRWHVDKTGELISLQLQPWVVEEAPHSRRTYRAANAISAAVEKAFTGLKFSSKWSRWLVHRADGVKIERPAYIRERGTLELVMSVDPDANYDHVYRFVLRVLERHPGYEWRGSCPTGFTYEEESEIEEMAKEGEYRVIAPSAELPTKRPSEAAHRVLRKLLRHRRELSQ